MYSHLGGSYADKDKFEYFFIGMSYIFLLSSIITFLLYLIIGVGGVLAHTEDNEGLYLIFTAMGLIPLTIFAVIYFCYSLKHNHYSHDGIITSTAFGVFTGLSCIYDCDNLGLPITFGLICVICFVTYLLIHCTDCSNFITSFIMLFIGICASIANFFLMYKMYPEQKGVFIIAMVVGIVVFVFLGCFILYLPNSNSDYDKWFYGANFGFLILTSPVTASTAIALVVVVIIYGNKRKKKKPHYHY